MAKKEKEYQIRWQALLNQLDYRREGATWVVEGYQVIHGGALLDAKPGWRITSAWLTKPQWTDTFTEALEWIGENKGVSNLKV